MKRRNKLSLSEAIREGAAQSKPLRGRFKRWRKGKLYACPLGCAAWVVGIEDWDFVLDELKRMYPILSAYYYSFLTGVRWKHTDYDVSEAIMWLNDNGHMTREEITDWVATLEKDEKERNV